nr:hypothetical protein [Tanacetum cinerariifolium]
LWKTVSKAPDTKNTIKFTLDRQEIFYTIDMFCDTLHLPVETLENPFSAPATIQVIKPFMQTYGYQGVIDNVSAFYMKLLAQSWQTMVKKFPSIPQRLDEDYHSIKDDIPLEYETMFIKAVVLMIRPQLVVSTQRKHRNTPSSYRRWNWSSAFLLLLNDDDDENEKDKKDEKKDDEEKDNDDHIDHTLVKTEEIGSLENRKEKMQTPIPTPSRYPRTELPSDKIIS